MTRQISSAWLVTKQKARILSEYAITFFCWFGSRCDTLDLRLLRTLPFSNMILQRILSCKMGRWKELPLKLMSLDKDYLLCRHERVSHLDASLHFTPRYLNSGLNFIQWNLLKFFGTIGLLK